MCILSFFALGLVGNLHPQSAMFLTMVLLVLLLIERYREWRGWLVVGVSGLAAVAGVFPFIQHFQWQRVRGGTLGGVQAAVNSLLYFGQARVPDRSVLEDIIAKAELHSNLLVFVLCVVPMLGGLWLAKRLRNGQGAAEPKAASLSARGVMIVLVLSVTGGLIFAFLSLFGMGGWFVSMHWLRAMRLAAPLAMVAIVLRLDGVDLLSRAKRWGTALLGGLVVLPTAATVAGVEVVYMTRFYPLKAVAQEAERRTSKGVLILTEPRGGCAFRVWSERSVVLTKADKNFLDSEGRRALRGFLDTVGKAYDKRKAKTVLQYAREFGADYVVLPVEDDGDGGPLRIRTYMLKRVKHPSETSDAGSETDEETQP